MLTDADRKLHLALGIGADLLELAGVRRLSDPEARDLLSINGVAGNFEGVEYPYRDPMRPGRRQTSRVRLDHPPLGVDGQPEGKYRSPYGDRRHLYFVPGTEAWIVDSAVPVVFVEAEKSALALAAVAQRARRPILPVALGGCWNWRGRIGIEADANGTRVPVKGALADFDLIPFEGRTAIVLFDARPNASVEAARRQFAHYLSTRGAAVQHGHLPDDDRQVNGPDDLVAVRGDAALWRVVDAAVPHDFTRHRGRVIAGNLDNIRLALARLGARPVYDDFAREVRLDGGAVTDEILDRIWIGIDDRFGWRPSKEVLLTIFRAQAHEAPVHPVRQYLERLTWDGTARLDTWLATYGGAVDTPYVRAVGALPLVAAVRRVRHPGAKFDELLILESAQGAFKSTALRTLCPDADWFSDDLPLGVDSKQVIERTAGKWIVEAAELHGNRGREAEALKSFLSRQVDGPVRLAYARLPTSVPRQFVLIGTTNTATSYLKDHTGGRRFWPVAVEKFDVECLARDRDQLWAEAAAREAKGVSIRLDPALWPAAVEEQEQRRAADPWEALLEPILEGDGIAVVDRVSVSAIWDTLKLEANALDNRHADRVAAIVQRHGFTRKQKIRVDGKPAWCWVREGGTHE